MLLEELKTEILDAREQREKQIQESVERTDDTIIVISTNIPGEDKVPQGAFRVFTYGCVAVRGELSTHYIILDKDAAGYFSILSCSENPETAKKIAVQIEETTEAARLLDIDVYSNNGKQIGRKELGLPPRKCLVCDEPAVDCIRSANHGIDIVASKVEGMLRGFKY